VTKGGLPMKKYRVIAKDDLEAFPHTWTKSLDYEVVEKEEFFTIASNEGQKNYFNEAKTLVLSEFDIQ
jgi:hypothetical protein